MAARGEDGGRKKRKELKGKKHGQGSKPRDVSKSHKAFKKSRKEYSPRSSVASELPSSLIVEADDPDFPRGGGSVLSRQEEAEARAEAEAEFEREEKEPRKGKGRRNQKGAKRQLPRNEDDLGSLFGEGVSGKLPRFPNRITLKNISPRMKLWGIIVEVNDKDLVVSLPGGLRGFIRLDDVSDIPIDNMHEGSESKFLSNIFHTGQLVACVVLRVDDDKKSGKTNKRIWLSLRLGLLYNGLTLDAVQDGMLLNAQVKSVEDHGYILYFGVSSFTGFLPKDERDGNHINSGQILQCVVKNIDKDRAVVHVGCNPDLVAKCVMRDGKGISIDLLIPGMMVNARVHASLESGLMLSFLTYFTGTVDIFHLQSLFPSGNWKDDYNQNKKVNARILFVDPSTRAVGLTLNPFLVNNKAPPAHAKTGDIYDESRIVRVDKGIGLLLELPSSPDPSPAYVSIFDASDEKVLKLEKKFKEGNLARMRVIGMRNLEGLAIGTLKTSAFEGSVFTHSDVKPGMLVKAKVITLEAFGAIVQFSSGVKALCPLPHMSELDIVKPPKKFKVGAELHFRVLGCKSKRITVTHKKTLVSSKLNVLASYADATEGLLTHGWITKIEKHGCFVRFYNGVQGFAHRTELGLDPGDEVDSGYHVGQVVKCRIINSASGPRRINVSFIIKPRSASEGDIPKLGCVVSGVVERLTPTAVVVHLNNYDSMKGIIFNEHLADFHGQATSLRCLLKPGTEFDQLLVIDCEEGKSLILSAKHSLINSVGQIPSNINEINPLSVIYGYICNIIETGCFVRFLGRLTGFSPKNLATDEQVDNFSDAFYIGQSVRSHILNVNNENDRIKLSLKQSLCSSSDVSLIQSFFLLEEKIATLQMANANTSNFSWVESFSIGSLVEGEIQEIKDLGVVLNFKDHPDVVGFVSNHQLGGVNVKTGSVVKAMVLDVVKSDSLVDLSLKPELVSNANLHEKKKKRSRKTFVDFKLHQPVNAVVEIVKENYLVLSIPEYSYAIGFALLTDYNIQNLPNKPFRIGQSVTATVGAVPSPESSGRLLLLPSTSTYRLEISNKKAKITSNNTLGSLVEVEVVDIKPLELVVKSHSGFHGRIHITEVFDDAHSVENPFAEFSTGQLLNARIVAKGGRSRKSSKGYDWELSVRSSVVAGNNVQITSPNLDDDFTFSVGSTVSGYVVKVDGEWVWLTVSRSAMAHMYILDTSCEPSELKEFQQRYKVGKFVKGRILSVNKEKKLLRMASCLALPLLSHEVDDGGHQENGTSHLNIAENISQGDIVGGRIKKILPGVGGILVQIGPHFFGKAHYTELVDEWIANPLSKYEEGQFVKCKILKVARSIEGNMHVDLSLRSSLYSSQKLSTALSTALVPSSKRVENVDNLSPGMHLQGYVKSISSKGCFIMLSRVVDARILLSNLSDGFIENPEKEFPVGKLIEGRILSVEPSSKRVELTLKKAEETDTKSGVDLHIGEIISGQIRRVESYGLFIAIDKTNMVGLCHISEISDEHVDNIEANYRAGDKVLAKILKIDEGRKRISLGMRKSYLGHKMDVLETSNQGLNDDHSGGESPADDKELSLQPIDNLICDQIMKECNNGDLFVLPQLERRALVPPLQVSLDDSELSDVDKVEVSNHDNMVNAELMRKCDRHTKKKAKQDKEFEVSASEQRLLENDMPMNVDDFEKRLKSSPNSSFIWIKYMAHMLSLADVEKARSIAERALKTINFREEDEKHNIWVAYFNLENEYGSPPEEAVKKIFQRALQYCDSKKIHMSLLGVYERTGQYKLASELLERMTKKFNSSCKVWVHYAQNLLQQQKDGIQSVINRALLSLPHKKHIQFLSKTAILEFKCGIADRGRSMFESVLREYPKRTDLWSIYLDQEIHMGDEEVIRALFERATCLSLPPKKMKFLLKKYLEYEIAHGDEARIEYVKKKALEYVESF